MALSIDQITAISYPAVLAEMRTPENQWAENSAMRFLEKLGFIERTSLGKNIEVPVDYRANPDAAFLVGDQDAASLVKTEVVTSAVYDIAQISVPVTWTKGDEAKNPEDNQKIALVRSLLENGITSHDDLIEKALFTTTGDFLGFSTLIPDSGQGIVGGIDANLETWWRNPVDSYTDGSNIEAAMTTVFNRAAKGSGSNRMPTLLLSGATAHALFEAQLQVLQRFQDANEARAGFKALAFKTATYVFSQYGGDRIYFLNPRNYKLVSSKQYFRDKGQTSVVPGQNAFYFLIYSALQAVVTAKSRLAVVTKV